jgi:type II secretory pathway pseudopilin PulG
MNQRSLLGTVALGAAGLFVTILVLFGFFAAVKSFQRYQARADAENQVKVSAIQIKNQAQRVQIAKQHAQIRFQNSVGIREAQDEIAKTLTPLYVQFEMVEALKAIATSGSNNSVVYIPSGANGIPLVSTTSPNEVKNPDGSK